MSIFEDDQNYLPSKLIKPGRKVKIPKPFFTGGRLTKMAPIVGSLGLGNLGWTKVTYVVYPRR